jgi:hypothetical protein
MAESFYGGATDYISKGCDMTYGSSGGPWIWRFHPYRGWSYNYVYSVVSGPASRTSVGDNIFTGPRFSVDNIVPICTLMGCGLLWPRP